MQHKGNQSLPKFYEEQFVNYGDNMRLSELKSQGVVIRGVSCLERSTSLIFDDAHKQVHVIDLKTGKGQENGLVEMNI